MGKAGRKRKEGKRKPSGRLATPGPIAREHEAKDTVLTQRYRRQRLSGYDKENREGELGDAFMREIVDAHQHRAGTDYNYLVRRYAALKGIPMPTPKGQRYDPTYGVRLAPDADEDVIAAIEASYGEAVSALKMAGIGAIREVNAVCVHNAPVSAPQHLRNGLDALCELWKLRESEPGQAPMTTKIKKWVAADARPTDREDLRGVKGSQS